MCLTSCCLVLMRKLHFNVCRGIVFPGAAVLRPPLLPVDQHIKVFSSVHLPGLYLMMGRDRSIVKAMPVHSDDGQIRTTRQSDSSFDLVLLTCMLGRLRDGSLPEEDVSSDGVTRAFAHDYAGSSAGCRSPARHKQEASSVDEPMSIWGQRRTRCRHHHW